MTESGAYAWVDEIEAACITVIRGGDVKAVLAAMGAAPATEHLATFAQAESAWASTAAPVQPWRSGDFLVVVEPNGFQGSMPDTLVAMAKGADAVCVFWNVNGVMDVQVITGNQIVRRFDPLLYDDGGSPLPEEEGLPFGTDGPVLASALVFLERKTGFALTRGDVLNFARATYFHDRA